MGAYVFLWTKPPFPLETQMLSAYYLQPADGGYRQIGSPGGSTSWASSSLARRRHTLFIHLL